MGLQTFSVAFENSASQDRECISVSLLIRPSIDALSRYWCLDERTHPVKAAHDVLTPVAIVKEGILGASKPIESKFGLIHALSIHTSQCIFTNVRN